MTPVIRNGTTPIHALPSNSPGVRVVAADITARLDALVRFVPPTAVVFSTEPGGLLRREETKNSEAPPYRVFRGWRGKAKTSIRVLETALEDDELELNRDGTRSTLRRGDAAFAAVENELRAIKMGLETAARDADAAERSAMALFSRMFE